MGVRRIAVVCCAILAAARETRWFQQRVDHFSASSIPSFEQRYLYDTSRLSIGGPLVFFCGNEGDVETFANFSGFVLEIASELGAAVVHGEHRFYGKSLPFKDQPFDRSHIQFLTVEQALADYAALVAFLTGPDGPADLHHAKVITIGGSYGGMLSSWMRSHYPSLVYAAVASSAPVRFDKVGPSFFELVTAASAAMEPSCPQPIREGFAAMLSPKNAHRLSGTFGLCSRTVDLSELELWARNAFVTLAMGNYPYAQDLFGNGLLAWPLRVACETLLSARDRGASVLEGFALSVNSYYNASRATLCHNIPAECRTCSDQTGCGTSSSLWGEAWDVEACSQIIYYTSTDNATDMFPPRAWGLPELRSYCRAKWRLEPQPSWFRRWYSKVTASSNIIFTSGLLDPWRGGCVLEDISQDILAFSHRDGAHIYDLARPHVNDTQAVVDVRGRVVSTLQSWLGWPLDVIHV